jgi:hypothetical protein
LAAVATRRNSPTSFPDALRRQQQLVTRRMPIGGFTRSFLFVVFLSLAWRSWIASKNAW